MASITKATLTDLFKRVNTYRAVYPSATGTQMGWAWRGRLTTEWTQGTGTTLTTEVQDAKDCLKIVTTGSNGYAEQRTPFNGQAAATYKYLVIRTKALADSQQLKIQWVTATNTGWDDNKSVTLTLGTTMQEYYRDLGQVGPWTGDVTQLRMTLPAAGTVWVEYLLIDSTQRNPDLINVKQTRILATDMNGLRQDMETLNKAAIVWTNVSGETGSNLRVYANRTRISTVHWTDIAAKLATIEASCWSGCDACNSEGCASCHGSSDLGGESGCITDDCGCHTSCVSDACSACHSSGGHTCTCNAPCNSYTQGGACGGSCHVHACQSCHHSIDACVCHTGGCYANNCDLCHGGGTGCAMCHHSVDGIMQQCAGCHATCFNDLCDHCHLSNHTCSVCYTCNTDSCSACHPSGDTAATCGCNSDACSCHSAECHIHTGCHACDSDTCDACHHGGNAGGGGCGSCNVDTCVRCHSRRNAI